jgi:hypothetical protein
MVTVEATGTVVTREYSWRYRLLLCRQRRHGLASKLVAG